MRKLLFYPQIAIPKNEWLTYSILYWDSIGSIVPLQYIENPNLHSPYMRRLIQENLLEQVIPDEHINRIVNFKDEFLNYVDTIDFDRENKNMKKIYIHQGKLGVLGKELAERRLAEKLDESWYLLDSRVGKEYMAYLAGVLSNESDYTPVSFENECLSDYLNISSLQYHQTRERIVETNELAQYYSGNRRIEILRELLVIPDGEVDLIDILRFKEKNYDQLCNFRNIIEQFLVEINSLTNNEKKICTENFIEKAKIERNTILEIMQRSKWYKFKTVDMISIIKPTIKLFSGCESNQPEIAGEGLSEIANVIMKRLNKNSETRRSAQKQPFAYSAKFNQKFSEMCKLPEFEYNK